MGGKWISPEYADNSVMNDKRLTDIGLLFWLHTY